MFLHFILLVLILLPLISNASFIEQSMGSAIVEDATAIYFNPSTLAFLKKKQFIALGTLGNTESLFSGQTMQLLTNSSFPGNAKTQSHFALPSVYYAMPLLDKWSFGLAVIANDIVKGIDSIARLGQSHSDNQIKTLDFVSALAYRLNNHVSVGGGLIRGYASYMIEPIAGFPNLEIPDFETHNKSSGDAWAGEIGVFIKPDKKMLIGLNHRSALTFNLSGESKVTGSPPHTSDGYNFTT